MLYGIARWTLLLVAAAAAVLAAMIGEPQDCSLLWPEWPCFLGLSRDS
jgi:hypothetical protein